MASIRRRRLQGVVAGLLALLVTLVLTSCGSNGEGSEVTARPRSGTTGEMVVATAPDSVDAAERIRVAIPTAWTGGRSDGRRRTFETGSATCRYRVILSAEVLLQDTDDPAAVVATLLPQGRRALDGGDRGSAAWRVERLAATDQVQIDGARAEPLRSLGEREGTPAWLAVRVRATSHPGDECHAGTWRETLGPAIGDLLATARRLG